MGALVVSVLGACGSETESEPLDRNMPAIEAAVEAPEDVQVDERRESVAEVLPTAEPEAIKEIVLTPEPTNTPEPTPAPTVEPTATPTPTPTEEPDDNRSVAPVGTDYILNTNTKKFHYPSCSSVDQMKDKNKKYYNGTREECIDMGYDPCGRCKP